MEPLSYTEKQVDSRASILSELEMAVNDEILAAFQYWTAYNASKGPGKFDADPVFEEHTKQEWDHVELLAQRIKELGGKFVTDPSKLRAHAAPWHPVESCDVKYLVQLILDAEIQAVNKYERLAAMTKDVDPVTHKIIVTILATEQEHRYEAQSLKDSLT